MTQGLEVFQDLVVRGAPDAIRGALSRLTDGRWNRDPKRESNLNERGSSEDAIVFEHEAADGLPKCFLTLFEDEEGYRVTNIVPVLVSSFTIQEYNRLLRDFQRRVVDPASSAGGLTVELTSPKQTMVDWVGPSAATALERFSLLANKSTGTAHPLDRERWYDFVIEANRATKRLSADRLAEWLHEVDGWSDDFAHELAGEYEMLLSFIEHYEARRL